MNKSIEFIEIKHNKMKYELWQLQWIGWLTVPRIGVVAYDVSRTRDSECRRLSNLFPIPFHLDFICRRMENCKILHFWKRIPIDSITWTWNAEKSIEILWYIVNYLISFSVLLSLTVIERIHWIDKSQLGCECVRFSVR